ncbi:hypothetical protein TNCV_1826261 [Trichonephila clavipes]|nr:hypothetical protein TNCV_1826261 [Trichonephila clavipes]
MCFGVAWQAEHLRQVGNTLFSSLKVRARRWPLRKRVRIVCFCLLPNSGVMHTAATVTLWGAQGLYMGAQSLNNDKYVFGLGAPNLTLQGGGPNILGYATAAKFCDCL